MEAINISRELKSMERDLSEIINSVDDDETDPKAVISVLDKIIRRLQRMKSKIEAFM